MLVMNTEKALLLYYGGKELHDICDTISSVKDDYGVVKMKLTHYFEPKINLTFEVYNFHQMKQSQDESIDQFVTRLKQKAQRCNFYDNDREIKDQVVFNCYSDRLRRKALRDDLDLQNLVAAARAIELSNKQAALIKKKDQEDLNRLKKPEKYSNKLKYFDKQKEPDFQRKCFSCGDSWLHKNGKSSCPAFRHTCKKCGKHNHFESKCKTKLQEINKIELSSSDSDDSYIYTIKQINKLNSKNNIKIEINDCDIEFQIDSGASVNVICEHDFNKLKNIELKTSKTKIFAYGSSTPLPIMGCFYL